MPNQSLTDFIATTNSDLERINELLNKTDAIETVYGIITRISKEEQVSFNILLVEIDNHGKFQKTEEVRKIKCESDFKPYMTGQYSLSSISREEFISFIEESLKNNFEEVFTFKIINGRIVQIHQGASLS